MAQSHAQPTLLIPPDESARRAKAVRSADAIMALEGFVKPAEQKALDEAFIAGVITMAEKIEFVQLGNRLAGARSVLEQLPPDDPRRAGIESRLTGQQEALRAMAVRFGAPVARAFGF